MSVPSLENLPMTFGVYTLKNVLGEGGMGRVYSAVLNGPAGFRKPVAIKLLHEGQPSDLVNEACISGMLRHPNIIDTYDLGETDGRLFIAMELVEGIALNDLLAKTSPLSPAAVLEIGRQLCFGLSHIHSLGFIHCDIKPSNLLLTRTGLIKIADFGVAIRTDDLQAESNRGSPPYMAPESVSGWLLDRRADIFSLGSVIFELVTGCRLFPGPSRKAAALQVLDVECLLAESAFEDSLEAVIPGIAAVLRQCLRRVPSTRFQDCTQVSEALERLSSPDVPGPTLLEIARLNVGVPDVVLTALDEPSLLSPSLTDAKEKSFVGRTAELTALGQALDGGARLVTLKGVGGVGKTALVRAFCRSQPGPKSLS